MEFSYTGTGEDMVAISRLDDTDRFDLAHDYEPFYSIPCTVKAVIQALVREDRDAFRAEVTASEDPGEVVYDWWMRVQQNMNVPTRSVLAARQTVGS